jgi:DNA-binding GntR family transcriptional regulator
MSLQRDAPLPLSQQLAAVLRAEIQSGARSPGSRLPTIMQLAAEHQIATATVVKALAILKREGLVTGSTGHGTFVAEHADLRLGSNVMHTQGVVLAARPKLGR